MSHPIGRLGSQGDHEHMQPCCGVGHHQNSTFNIEDIIKSKHFEWDRDNNCIERIRAKSKRVTSSKLILMSYLFGYCCDLSLSNKCNVSHSAGFEAINSPRRTKKMNLEHYFSSD